MFSPIVLLQFTQFLGHFQVALRAPLTRFQYEESSLLWPTHFHENKEIERTLDGTFFNTVELDRIDGFMRTAIGISTEAGQVRSLLSSPSSSLSLSSRCQFTLSVCLAIQRQFDSVQQLTVHSMKSFLKLLKALLHLSGIESAELKKAPLVILGSGVVCGKF